MKNMHKLQIKTFQFFFIFNNLSSKVVIFPIRPVEGDVVIPIIGSKKPKVAQILSSIHF